MLIGKKKHLLSIASHLAQNKISPTIKLISLSLGLLNDRRLTSGDTLKHTLRVSPLALRCFFLKIFKLFVKIND